MIAMLISIFDHMTGNVAFPCEKWFSVIDSRRHKMSNPSKLTGNIQWIYVGHSDCPCNTCTANAIDPINAHS